MGMQQIWFDPPTVCRPYTFLVTTTLSYALLSMCEKIDIVMFYSKLLEINLGYSIYLNIIVGFFNKQNRNENALTSTKTKLLSFIANVPRQAYSAYKNLGWSCHSLSWGL